MCSPRSSKMHSIISRRSSVASWTSISCRSGRNDSQPAPVRTWSTLGRWPRSTMGASIASTRLSQSMSALGAFSAMPWARIVPFVRLPVSISQGRTTRPSTIIPLGNCRQSACHTSSRCGFFFSSALMWGSGPWAGAGSSFCFFFGSIPRSQAIAPGVLFQAPTNPCAYSSASLSSPGL